MTSYKPPQFLKRRQVLASSLLIGVGLRPGSLLAQTDSAGLSDLQPASAQELSEVIAAYLEGQTPIENGLKLYMPVLGDNPAAVPVKITFTKTITSNYYCRDLIIIAEGNPNPVACRFKFTPLAGTNEVAIRLRLIDSQYITVLAKMNDDKILQARQHINVTAGACGM